MTKDELFAQVVKEREVLYNPSLHIPDLITTISPNDTMYEGADKPYFDVGYSALNAIQLALLAAGKEKNEIENILDLPCGHGRVLRTIKAAFPMAHLSACDIDTAGVDFCSRTFNATPIYSSHNIESIPIKSKFDLIWVGSLFTHLDSQDWEKFMALFCSILNPEGILILTVAGQLVYRLIEIGDLGGIDAAGAKRIIKGYRKKGFGYASYRSTGYAILNSKEKDKPKYGRSVVKKSWMALFLEKYPELKLLNYTERGWVRRQDVISLQKITPI